MQHALDGVRHEDRLVEQRLDRQAVGAAARIVGIAALTLLTTFSVEALPFLMICISTACWPSALTTLTCGGPPSRT